MPARTRTKQRNVSKPMKNSKGAAKKKSRKRKLNAFFKVMLKAKHKGDESFVYNGQTYKGRKHPKLGMVYKRA